MTTLTFNSRRCPGSVVVKGFDDARTSAMIVHVKSGLELEENTRMIKPGDWFILPVTDNAAILDKLHQIAPGPYPQVKQALIAAFQ